MNRIATMGRVHIAVMLRLSRSIHCLKVLPGGTDAEHFIKADNRKNLCNVAPQPEKYQKTVFLDNSPLKID
jgi:hypothetical protein